MKTKLIILSAIFAFSQFAIAKNDTTASTNEMKAAQNEIFKDITQSVKKLSSTVNKDMNGLHAEIFLQVNSAGQVIFYRVECENPEMSRIIKEHLKKQHFVGQPILMGEKFSVQVRFKYI
ncbi:MAG: hypothetical protein GVY19_03275 [Bacteroidetes bacterium]|jgi:hypothetical protein|nr:hypothetical protein [Bacteroidota bacterium]